MQILLSTEQFHRVTLLFQQERTKRILATINGTKFSNVVKKVYNILLIIGVAISVIIVGVMGIRIITGSAEDKAEIKEQMVPYLIGEE